MKPVTCGLVLITPQNKILLVHSTNSSWKSWSFPKGMREEGESSAEAAARETFEETGLDFRGQTASFVDLGRHDYNKEKDAHFFLHYLIGSEAFYHDLACASLFDDHGVPTPEIDGFRFVDFEEVPGWLSRSSIILFDKFDLTGVCNHV